MGTACRRIGAGLSGPEQGSRDAASPGGERAVPFYCPYCGEEDLEPVGERGGWWCHSCDRRFTLRSDGNGATA
jgi:predicted RNA-binding Zn-ribbon protein involved in translation (DUF1610 family)